jgi:hypothetical protein
VWLFIVAPLIGGALAAAVEPILTPEVAVPEGEPGLADPTGANVPPSIEDAEPRRYEEVEVEERIERWQDPYPGDQSR